MTSVRISASGNRRANQHAEVCLTTAVAAADAGLGASSCAAQGTTAVQLAAALAAEAAAAPVESGSVHVRLPSEVTPEHVARASQVTVLGRSGWATESACAAAVLRGGSGTRLVAGSAAVSEPQPPAHAQSTTLGGGVLLSSARRRALAASLQPHYAAPQPGPLGKALRAPAKRRFWALVKDKLSLGRGGGGSSSGSSSSTGEHLVLWAPSLHDPRFMPFLSAPLRQALLGGVSTAGGDGDLVLYRGMVHPDVPGLAFVGLEAHASSSLLLLELQAQWLAAHLAGQLALPPAAAMHADVAAQRAWRSGALAHPLMSAGCSLARRHEQCCLEQLLEDLSGVVAVCDLDRKPGKFGCFGSNSVENGAGSLGTSVMARAKLTAMYQATGRSAHHWWQLSRRTSSELLARPSPSLASVAVAIPAGSVTIRRRCSIESTAAGGPVVLIPATSVQGYGSSRASSSQGIVSVPSGAAAAFATGTKSSAVASGPGGGQSLAAANTAAGPRSGRAESRRHSTDCVSAPAAPAAASAGAAVASVSPKPHTLTGYPSSSALMQRRVSGGHSGASPFTTTTGIASVRTYDTAPVAARPATAVPFGRQSLDLVRRIPAPMGPAAVAAAALAARTTSAASLISHAPNTMRRRSVLIVRETAVVAGGGAGAGAVAGPGTRQPGSKSQSQQHAVIAARQLAAAAAAAAGRPHSGASSLGPGPASSNTPFTTEALEHVVEGEEEAGDGGSAELGKLASARVSARTAARVDRVAALAGVSVPGGASRSSVESQLRRADAAADQLVVTGDSHASSKCSAAAAVWRPASDRGMAAVAEPGVGSAVAGAVTRAPQVRRPPAKRQSRLRNTAGAADSSSAGAAGPQALHSPSAAAMAGAGAYAAAAAAAAGSPSQGTAVPALDGVGAAVPISRASPQLSPKTAAPTSRPVTCDVDGGFGYTSESAWSATTRTAGGGTATGASHEHERYSAASAATYSAATASSAVHHRASPYASAGARLVGGGGGGGGGGGRGSNASRNSQHSHRRQVGGAQEDTADAEGEQLHHPHSSHRSTLGAAVAALAGAPRRLMAAAAGVRRAASSRRRSIDSAVPQLPRALHLSFASVTPPDVHAPAAAPELEPAPLVTRAGGNRGGNLPPRAASTGAAFVGAGSAGTAAYAAQGPRRPDEAVSSAAGGQRAGLHLPRRQLARPAPPLAQSPEPELGLPRRASSFAVGARRWSVASGAATAPHLHPHVGQAYTTAGAADPLEGESDTDTGDDDDDTAGVAPPTGGNRATASLRGLGGLFSSAAAALGLGGGSGGRGASGSVGGGRSSAHTARAGLSGRSFTLAGRRASYHMPVHPAVAAAAAGGIGAGGAGGNRPSAWHGSFTVNAASPATAALLAQTRSLRMPPDAADMQIYLQAAQQPEAKHRQQHSQNPLLGASRGHRPQQQQAAPSARKAPASARRHVSSKALNLASTTGVAVSVLMDLIEDDGLSLGALQPAEPEGGSGRGEHREEAGGGAAATTAAALLHQQENQAATAAAALLAGSASSAGASFVRRRRSVDATVQTGAAALGEWSAGGAPAQLTAPGGAPNDARIYSGASATVSPRSSTIGSGRGSAATPRRYNRALAVSVGGHSSAAETAAVVGAALVDAPAAPPLPSAAANSAGRRRRLSDMLPAVLAAMLPGGAGSRRRASAATGLSPIVSSAAFVPSLTLDVGSGAAASAACTSSRPLRLLPTSATGIAERPASAAASKTGTSGTTTALANAAAALAVARETAADVDGELDHAARDLEDGCSGSTGARGGEMAGAAPAAVAAAQPAGSVGQNGAFQDLRQAAARQLHEHEQAQAHRRRGLDQTTVARGVGRLSFPLLPGRRLSAPMAPGAATRVSPDAAGGAAGAAVASTQAAPQVRPAPLSSTAAQRGGEVLSRSHRPQAAVLYTESAGTQKPALGTSTPLSSAGPSTTPSAAPSAAASPARGSGWAAGSRRVSLKHLMFGAGPSWQGDSSARSGGGTTHGAAAGHSGGSRHKSLGGGLLAEAAEAALLPYSQRMGPKRDARDGGAASGGGTAARQQSAGGGAATRVENPTRQPGGRAFMGFGSPPTAAPMRADDAAAARTQPPSAARLPSPSVPQAAAGGVSLLHSPSSAPIIALTAARVAATGATAAAAAEPDVVLLQLLADADAPTSEALACDRAAPGGPSAGRDSGCLAQGHGARTLRARGQTTTDSDEDEENEMPLLRGVSLLAEAEAVQVQEAAAKDCRHARGVPSQQQSPAPRLMPSQQPWQQLHLQDSKAAVDVERMLLCASPPLSAAAVISQVEAAEEGPGEAPPAPPAAAHARLAVAWSGDGCDGLVVIDKDVDGATVGDSAAIATLPTGALTTLTADAEARTTEFGATAAVGAPSATAHANTCSMGSQPLAIPPATASAEAGVVAQSCVSVGMKTTQQSSTSASISAVAGSRAGAMNTAPQSPPARALPRAQPSQSRLTAATFPASQTCVSSASLTSFTAVRPNRIVPASCGSTTGSAATFPTAAAPPLPPPPPPGTPVAVRGGGLPLLQRLLPRKRPSMPVLPSTAGLSGSSTTSRIAAVANALFSRTQAGATTGGGPGPRAAAGGVMSTSAVDYLPDLAAAGAPASPLPEADAGAGAGGSYSASYRPSGVGSSLVGAAGRASCGDLVDLDTAELEETARLLAMRPAGADAAAALSPGQRRAPVIRQQPRSGAGAADPPAAFSPAAADANSLAAADSPGAPVWRSGPSASAAAFCRLAGPSASYVSPSSVGAVPATTAAASPAASGTVRRKNSVRRWASQLSSGAATFRIRKVASGLFDLGSPTYAAQVAAAAAADPGPARTQTISGSGSIAAFIGVVPSGTGTGSGTAGAASGPASHMPRDALSLEASIAALKSHVAALPVMPAGYAQRLHARASTSGGVPGGASPGSPAAGSAAAVGTLSTHDELIQAARLWHIRNDSRAGSAKHHTGGSQQGRPELQQQGSLRLAHANSSQPGMLLSALAASAPAASGRASSRRANTVDGELAPSTGAGASALSYAAGDAADAAAWANQQALASPATGEAGPPASGGDERRGPPASGGDERRGPAWAVRKASQARQEQLVSEITANLREALANGRRGGGAAAGSRASGPGSRIAGALVRVGAAVDATTMAPPARFGTVFASAPVDWAAHAIDGDAETEW
ncbi:hypothetical protein HXX76_011801 [Chlamydomonas incerta]|uniref:Uncharacterized protein n=1 Tax=Chlamydomonas incerta TaxID=51695 RepID=A0A835SX35_CHLIN|nr:hypothetical protein HXX76_011801 [Chlamydomonas incerta]|eukprot:KAG2428120.1 hypothetical protein HXX76_011801 [Chlamydomonas incerta]